MDSSFLKDYGYLSALDISTEQLALLICISMAVGRLIIKACMEGVSVKLGVTLHHVAVTGWIISLNICTLNVPGNCSVLWRDTG